MLQINKEYYIYYIDRNYPCRCPCHYKSLQIKHCIPCCYDRSYQGKVVLLELYEDQTCKVQKINQPHWLIVNQNILQELYI